MRITRHILAQLVQPTIETKTKKHGNTTHHRKEDVKKKKKRPRW